MLYCANCGSELNDMVLFCGVCGSGAEGTNAKPLPTREQQKEEMRRLMCEEIRRMPEFSQADFGELGVYEQNRHGQVYAEMTTVYRTVRGDNSTARFCAVGEIDGHDGGVSLAAGSPQRMADFAKTYLAKRTLGFRD